MNYHGCKGKTRRAESPRQEGEMTGQEVLALVKKHGSQKKAAKAAGVAKSTFNEWVKKAQRGAGGPDAGENVRTESFKGLAVAAEHTPSSASGGFSLRGVNLLEERPQGTIKKRLFSLRRGMGYRVDELSKEWHMSVETLRKHAKEYDALRYVEITPGEYVACIVHPDTVKENRA